MPGPRLSDMSSPGSAPAPRSRFGCMPSTRTGNSPASPSIWTIIATTRRSASNACSISRAELDDAQRARLADIAERTPVTLALKAGATINHESGLMGEFGIVEPYATLTLKDGRKLGYLDVGKAGGSCRVPFPRPWLLAAGSFDCWRMRRTGSACASSPFDRPGIGYSDLKEGDSPARLAERRRRGQPTSSASNVRGAGQVGRRALCAGLRRRAWAARHRLLADQAPCRRRRSRAAPARACAGSPGGSPTAIRAICAAA